MRFKYIAVGVIVLTVVGVWQVRAGRGPGAKQDSQGTADLIRHGEYLVSSATMCGDCHTPQDDRGQPDRSRLLQGGALPIRPKKEAHDWADESPDITASGLTGEWSEEAMVKFLTTGINPDGKKAMAPMPAFRLNATDARAVVLYLKSVAGGQKAGTKEKRSKSLE
jgi:mono/diheme cytochrome c family protein